jgi:hypothetical protein
MTEEQKQQLVDEYKTITLGNLLLEGEKAGLTLRQYIKQAVRDGATPDELKGFLLRDLREGGQIFGSYRRQFRGQVVNNVEKTARDAKIYIQEAELKKGKETWTWVLEASANNCDDCLGRSGLSYTMQEWRGLGLPQGGRTICGQYCNCELISDGIFTQDMVNEVKKQYAERIST